jgi:hypothetical protein
VPDTTQRQGSTRAPGLNSILCWRRSVVPGTVKKKKKRKVETFFFVRKDDEEEAKKKIVAFEREKGKENEKECQKKNLLI